MTRCLIALLLVIFETGSSERRVSFTGVVNLGDGFSRTLPNGLVFEVKPGSCGWMINIHEPGTDSEDYVWPENPPIRQKNALFLDDSYDGNWESPLKNMHRIFFAKNRAQAKRKLDWIAAFERGDYENANKLDLPNSALGEADLSIASFKTMMVPHKVVANSKDNYCATDMHFSVVISRY